MRVWLLVLVGCGDGKDPEDTGGSPGDTGVVEDTDEPDDPGPLGMVTGRLVDADGDALVDVVVTMCRDVCKAERTDESGAYVHEVAPGPWSMEVTIEPGNAQSTWAMPLAPVTVIEDDTVAFDAPLVVPRLGDRVALDGAGPVQVADGLTLVADPSGWEAPVLDPDAEPWVAAVGLDPDTAGLPLEGLAGEPLALWYVAPTDSHLATPWGLRVTNIWELEPGDTVEAWVSDYSAQAWTSAGTLTVSGDGEELASADGEGLPVLGSVVLMR